MNSARPLLSASMAAWAARRGDEVLGQAATALRCYVAAPEQRRLLDIALLDLRANVARQELLGPVHLPLLVYRGLGRDEEAALPLAAATSLLNLGLHLLDDVADGGLSPHWTGCHPAEIVLTASTLFAALPQLIIADLDAPPARRLAIQRMVADMGLRMSAGQQRDLALTGRADVRSADVEAVAAAKAGEELALCTAPAAQLAGAPASVVDLYAALGLALGTGGGLASDCYDLFNAPDSQDLANGTRTLPVVLHLERLAGPERAHFLALLEQARHDKAARETVHERLRAAGALWHCAVIIETYCQRAQRALEQLAPEEPTRSLLAAKIDEMSFFPAGSSAPGGQ